MHFKHCAAVVSAVCMLAVFAGCQPAGTENTGTAENTQTAPVMSDIVDTQSPSVGPATASPDMQQEGADLVAVRKIPLYDDVPLESGENIAVLDIAGTQVLFCINETTTAEQGLDTTKSVAVYDMETRTVTASIEVQAGYVFHGALVGDDFVISGVGEEDTEGYVCRVGTHTWEYLVANVIPDGDALPQPVAFPSGNVIFVDCGTSYAYLLGKDDEPDDEPAKIVRVAPDGSVETLFTYEPSETQVSTWLRRYGSEDEYMFERTIEKVGDGIEIYSVNEDGAQPLLTIADCRAVYPWWVAETDRFLLSIGYGDDQHGITTIETVLMNSQGEVLTADDKPYFRLTSDGAGHIAAVNRSWEQYLLGIDGDKITAVRIDLPTDPTDFYHDGSGKLYAHLFLSPGTGKPGLFEILV